MQDASGMCATISRLFCYEFSAETFLRCQVWAFLISFTQNKLPNLLAASCCGRTEAEMRPPASPPAADPGLGLISRDTGEGVQCRHPYALHGAVARHNTRVLSGGGSGLALLMSPKLLPQLNSFGDWLRDTKHQDKESRFHLPQVG